MSEDFSPQEFFTISGTLSPDSPSYVKRPADEELFRQLTAGQYCYVLSARQMGKSSLMIRTARRLWEQGIRPVSVDLTEMGKSDSPDQWYAGFLTLVSTRLQIPVNALEWWDQCGGLPLTQKFITFMRDVVLETVQQRVVIFIDEIDTMLRLSFRDDFFAGIRAMFNARASDEAFSRISFALLGVASPVDLIEDRVRTPYNVGVVIPLGYFSREGAQVLESPLEQAYPGRGSQIFDRIYYWTSGHPYLTQKLSQAIVENNDPDWTKEKIDRLVQREFLSGEAHRENNLQFVRENILTSEHKQQLLALYAKVFQGKIIQEDRSSIIHNRLKLSGLVSVEDDHFVTSNEIYRRVFNLAWARKNMAINWARIAAIAASLVSILAFALLGTIYYNNSVRIPAEVESAENCAYNPKNKPEERLTCLAKLIRSQPLLNPTDYDFKAREAFFSMSTWEEQVSIFETTHPNSDDLTRVIRAVYTSLADVNGDEKNIFLLHRMDVALARALQASEGSTPSSVYQPDEQSCNVTEQLTPLQKEIRYWICANGRKKAGDIDTAITYYNKAITWNPGNPATHYERGMLYLLKSQENPAVATLALADFDALLSQAEEEDAAGEGEAYLTLTPSITPSETATSDVTAKAPPETEGGSGAGVPTRTPTPGAPAAITPAPEENALTPAPTPIDPHRPVQPDFSTYSKRLDLVRKAILGSPELVSAYKAAPETDYSYLRKRVSLPPEPPRISFASTQSPSTGCVLTPGQTVQFSISGDIPEDAKITWGSFGGSFDSFTGNNVTYTAPTKWAEAVIPIKVVIELPSGQVLKTIYEECLFNQPPALTETSEPSTSTPIPEARTKVPPSPILINTLPPATPMPPVNETYAARTATVEKYILSCPPKVMTHTSTNCREGPGTRWKVVTIFPGGTTLEPTGLVGLDPETWLYIPIRSTRLSCWVLASAVNVSGNTACLPVYTIPPTYTPAPELSPTETIRSLYSFVQSGEIKVIDAAPFPDHDTCKLWVAGQTYDLQGTPMAGITVMLGGSLDSKNIYQLSLTGTALQYGPAGYEFTVADKLSRSKQTAWVQLFDQAMIPLSGKVYFDTFDDCKQNLSLINFRQIR